MRNTTEALRTIVLVLRRERIPFQITGGFAANVYGTTRKLADIDIEVRDKDLRRIADAIPGTRIYGPKRYRDQNWDLQLLTIRYLGQEFDFCGCDSERIRDKKTRTWHLQRVSLTDAKRKRVFGMHLPFVRKEALIAYKRTLDRPVDRLDVQELTTSRALPRRAWSNRAPCRARSCG